MKESSRLRKRWRVACVGAEEAGAWPWAEGTVHSLLWEENTVRKGVCVDNISRWEGDRESMHGAPKVFFVTGGKREGGLPW